MKRILTILIGIAAVLAVGMPNVASAATEQAKQAAIDAGLAWLALPTVQSADGHWEYGDLRSDIAATASAALAFIEEGHYPGSGTAYETHVTKAVTYLFNQAQSSAVPWETAVYSRHAEDYNGDGVLNDGGNDKMLYFGSTDIYSNGIVAPMLHALGQKMGPGSTVGIGTAAISTSTYKQAMQDVVDWFSYGQVEPNIANHRGGWRYYPNYSTSDNSTAQWGALPILYAKDMGLKVPQYVKNELNLWVNYVQHSQDGSWQAGGSGYDNPNTYVNMAKTGGLMLELAAIGADVSDPRVQNAIAFMQSMTSFDHWNQGYLNSSSQWYGGHLNNPYAMWAVYKALSVYGIDTISTAPGGFTVGQDWDPQTSAAGDWFAHYCDLLVGLQNANGSWSGNYPWTGVLATGWYINILNAAGVPEPVNVIPEPLTVLGVFAGVAGLAGYIRKRRSA